MNRAQIDDTGAVHTVCEARQSPTHIQTLDGTDYTVAAANGLTIGVFEQGDHRAVVLTTLREQTDPVGLDYTMSPDHAREIAAMLIAAAEELERDAAAATIDVIARAGRR